MTPHIMVPMDTEIARNAIGGTAGGIGATTADVRLIGGYPPEP
jgi:hypothetical protein